MNGSVIVINQDDQMLGTMGKMAAHRTGSLHRAFSVFIFNTSGELLLQQRAPEKYHSGNLWTNTCCSHPRPGEFTADAAYRRLEEEMGIRCLLDYVFNFTYKAVVSNDLVEHELDHVFFGVSDDVPETDPGEVSAYRYIKMDELARELKSNPQQYTQWLNICFDRVMKCYTNLFLYESLAD